MAGSGKQDSKATCAKRRTARSILLHRLIKYHGVSSDCCPLQAFEPRDIHKALVSILLKTYRHLSRSM